MIKSPYFIPLLSVKILSYGPLNSATHIFTRLERLLTISDRGRIAGVCCPNQIKNHHFVICRALTSYLSLNFIITNNHTELQSLQGTSILFAVLVYFLRNYLGLHQTRTHLVVCCVRRQKNLDFSNFFFICGILGQNQEKVSFLVDPCCSKAPKQAFIELKEKIKMCIFFAFLSI